ncbi:MAG: hypothetical protein GY719_25730 [bacterium]|nr:hypothetical protein [bacterium]
MTYRTLPDGATNIGGALWQLRATLDGQPGPPVTHRDLDGTAPPTCFCGAVVEHGQTSCVECRRRASR